MTTESLLIEFLTEELPPINLFENIGNAFASLIKSEIKTFLSSESQIYPIVTPRRFGCVITNVALMESDIEITKKGPAIEMSLIDDNPTKALLGFMRSIKIENVESLIRDNGYFYAIEKITGRNLYDVLGCAINNAIRKLPIAKHMRWGDNTFTFIRPVHNLLITYGGTHVDVKDKILGLHSTNFTSGHRVLSPSPIFIQHADDYFKIMHSQGMVMASFEERKDYIYKELHRKADELKLTLKLNHGLLNEVCGLTECPQVLCGKFDEAFLNVPKECLIVSMEKHQRYFALMNGDNLSNHFLFVANIKATDNTLIIEGNERVLRARLGDAKFFYKMDKSHQLSFFVDKLSHVVYHNKLGTQLDRIYRLEYIAGHLAKFFNIEENIAKQGAYLMKGDLTTEMVGEFPELQGVMGKYYALLQNESKDIANAIEQHYYPRFSGDALPEGRLSLLLALTDKLETLVGIWGVGLIPTGDKDQFGLRRMALGVARILLEHKLDLMDMLDITYQAFDAKLNIKHSVIGEVYEFILIRLHNYLLNKYDNNSHIISSICETNPNTFTHMLLLIKELRVFAQNGKIDKVINSNKRIENILKKHPNVTAVINTELLTHDAEINLYDLAHKNQDKLSIVALSDKWSEYFDILSGLNIAIDNLFDNVMINDEKEDIKNNRMALLKLVYDTMNSWCRLSKLQVYSSILDDEHHEKK